MEIEINQIHHEVEVILQKERKRCSLTDVSYETLLTHLRSCFFYFDEKNVQYIDDEGDLIVMSTTEELELALKLSPKVLRIVLQPRIVRKDIDKERTKKRKPDELTENMEKLQIEENESVRNKKFRLIAETADVQLPADGTWPSEFERLFVDGNNLMYLTAGLRKLTLQKKKRQAEQALANIVEIFSAKFRVTSILIFDGTQTKESKVLQNGSVMSITSARPEFSTSDKALIHWAKNNPDSAKKTLVVTSDRALSGELAISCVKTVKPARWLKFLSGVASGNPSIDFMD